ncbi:MAG: helix-turn-helix transcriptional regulator [Pseudomonadota bacterium]
MTVTIPHHIGPYPPGHAPSAERPLRLCARALEADTMLLAHRHDWGQVTLALSGVFRVRVPGSSWTVPPLRAIWIAPHVEHEVTVLEAATLCPLWVHAARAPFAGDECKVLSVSPLLRELVVALDHCAPGPREDLLAGLILDELAGAATRPIRVPLPRDKRLQALCERLITEPSNTLPLARWAPQVGASERTLARLFEQELGMSFGQWRQQVRLAHAAPLIARGMPMAQVAAELGYSSQSAFSAMFKKMYCSSPSEFFAA